MCALPSALAQSPGAVVADQQEITLSDEPSIRSALDAVAQRDGLEGAFLALVHGYNTEFEDGSWGLRGVYPLPLSVPLGLSGGLDYYPQGESNSLTVLGIGAACAYPMTVLGGGHAFVSAGPRLYRSSYSGGSSSSSTDIAVGATVGATYPVGPVVVYGDIGADRVYDTLTPYTRFGVGYPFGK